MIDLLKTRPRERISPPGANAFRWQTQKNCLAVETLITDQNVWTKKELVETPLCYRLKGMQLHKKVNITLKRFWYLDGAMPENSIVMGSFHYSETSPLFFMRKTSFQSPPFSTNKSRKRAGSPEHRSCRKTAFYLLIWPADRRQITISRGWKRLWFWGLRQGCQMAKFDPFLSLDCARVEGMGAQSKERKGSNFAA